MKISYFIMFICIFSLLGYPVFGLQFQKIDDINLVKLGNPRFTLFGYVTNAKNGSNISGAKITMFLEDVVDETTFSNNSGYYEINFDIRAYGAYIPVTASKENYKDSQITIEAYDRNNPFYYNFSLTPKKSINLLDILEDNNLKIEMDLYYFIKYFFWTICVEKWFEELEKILIRKNLGRQG